jgi:hypothetical protein
VVHPACPASLYVILRFLSLSGSLRLFIFSVTVELTFSISVTGLNAHQSVNRLHEHLHPSQRLFTSSVSHLEVFSSPLAETISGFWQLHCIVLQFPSDLVQIHLHHWICSEQIWTARICAPRSTVGIGFRSPPTILSLSRGGGSEIGRASLEQPGLKHLDQ